MSQYPIHRRLVKPIPFWFRYVPFFGTSLAMTIGARMYLPHHLYTDLMSATPTNESMSVYVHEHTHIARQLEMGPLIWNVWYIVSRRFRLAEELLAIKKEMAYRHTHGIPYNIVRKAKHFSSSTYLWVLPYEASVETLRKQWQEVVSTHQSHGN